MLLHESAKLPYALKLNSFNIPIDKKNTNIVI